MKISCLVPLFLFGLSGVSGQIRGVSRNAQAAQRRLKEDKLVGGPVDGNKKEEMMETDAPTELVTMADTADTTSGATDMGTMDPTMPGPPKKRQLQMEDDKKDDEDDKKEEEDDKKEDDPEDDEDDKPKPAGKEAEALDTEAPTELATADSSTSSPTDAATSDSTM
jgi:hypothetical protein